jgi:hypothetical protein
MQASILEPRPLYAIGTVARLTGLKPDTLRVWERRYGLGASHKSASGRRQYTQADLEHLQLVAALVGSGVRIGEIASAGRKTLEVLLRRTVSEETAMPPRKPTVLFVGAELCSWIDEHQGCLSHVSANLARISLAEAKGALAGEIEAPDMLVIGCKGLGFVQIQEAQELASALGSSKTLVVHKGGSERGAKTLEQSGIACAAFPPEPGFLVHEITRFAAEQACSLTDGSLSTMLSAKPAQFTADDLARMEGLQDSRQADLASLVRKLGEMERVIAADKAGDWPETSVSACAYAYAGQARWLLEKALQVMQSQGDTGGRGRVAMHRGGRLNDAA